MEQRYPPQKTPAMEPVKLQDQLSDMIAQVIAPGEPKPGLPVGSTPEDIEKVSDRVGGLRGALAYDSGVTDRQQNPNISENHLSAHLPVTNGDHESLSNVARNTPTSSSPSQNHNPLAVDIQAPFDYPQPTPMSLGPGTDEPQPQKESDAQSHASGSDVNGDGDGVNYQALLDNLSPSISTAPTLDNITSITTVTPLVPSSPGSVQIPIATLPIPAGLPPRPPPQEKPAIHPNYTPGEDIRTYHNPPAQNPSGPASYSTQSKNPSRPLQGYNPNNSIAPNGMPPPPIATFQQPLSKANQPQGSPQDQTNRQKENLGRNGGRASVSQDGEDEGPRRPEVEKVYEEFLREEAVYVAEGTWDRFPQGSRLFVGPY